jgi:PAS domain S-box-containing protein
MKEKEIFSGDLEDEIEFSSSQHIVDSIKPWFMNDLKHGTRHSLKLFIFITILLIILAGMTSLLILHFFPNLTLGAEILIDLTLLIFIIVPLFYFFAYQPLLRYYRQEREAQTVLERTNEKIQKLEFELEQSPIIFYDCSFNKGFTINSISKNVSHFGYSSEEFINNSSQFSALIHPDDYDRIIGEVNEDIAAGLNEFKKDFRIITKDGDSRWVSSYNWIDRGNDGSILNLQGIMLDVTNRIKISQNYQQAEQLVESIFSMTHVLKCHLDSEFNLLRVNSAFSEFVGEDVVSLRGKNISELFQDFDFKDEFEKVIRENATIVIHDQKISGSPGKDTVERYWDLVVQPIRNIQEENKGILLSMIDVTDHALARKETELERNKLMDILNAMQDGVYIISEDHEVEYANPVIEKEFGKLSNQKCFEYFHNAKEPCSHCHYAPVKQHKIVNYEQEIPSNGKIYDVLDIPIDNPDGSVSKLKVMHDISNLKANERSLKRYVNELKQINAEAQKQRKIAEALAEASFVLNRNLELDIVIEHILTQVRKGIPFTKAYLILLKRNSNSIDRHHSIDGINDSGLIELGHLRYENFPLYNEIIDTKNSILLGETTSAEEWGNKEGWEWVKSFLSVPILLDDKVIGFINLLDKNPGTFNDEHCDQLSAFASQASMAIENARLFEQISEAKERLQILSHHQTKILEDERQYIARELHDEAGQALTSLSLEMQLVESKIDDRDFVLEKIAKINKTLVNVSQNLHNIAMTLRPASLDHLGLVSAINQYVDAIKGTSPVRIVVKNQGISERLPHNIETMIYRIVQEALTNVIRHAHATRAEVVLKHVDHKLIVSIEDDGIGFDPNISPTPSHIGLLGMQERIQIVNGKLNIDSAHDKGTKILVEVDCDNPDSGC